MSPTLNWPSSRISMPLNMSLTMFCAARPMAMPATPAEASSGARLKPIAVKDLQAGDDADDGQAGGTDDSGHGSDFSDGVPGRRHLLGNADHAGGYDAQYSAEHKGDDRNYDQARQLGVDEFLAVVDPLVENAAEEATLLEPAPARYECELRRRRKKRHAKTPLSRLNCAQDWPGLQLTFLRQSLQNRSVTIQAEMVKAMNAVHRRSVKRKAGQAQSWGLWLFALGCISALVVAMGVGLIKTQAQEAFPLPAINPPGAKAAPGTQATSTPACRATPVISSQRGSKLRPQPRMRKSRRSPISVRTCCRWRQT